MRHRLPALVALAVTLVAPLEAQAPDAIPARYRDVANRIIAAAEADSVGAWDRIAELSDRLFDQLL